MQQLGRYTLDRLIGQGGAGAVYASTHPLLGIPVAIKVMLTNDAAARAAFLHEAQVVAALSHPNIINIFDVNEAQGQPFLVMELLDSSLADRVAQGPMRLAEAVPLLLPLLDALAYAHHQGLIHRDLKPANVLLRTDQTPVLADFGLALKPVGQQQAELVGTPEYMAPEQLRNQPLDARTDIYALGALLYELLTGRPPFVGDVKLVIRGHLQEQPEPPSQHNPSIPAEADQLILEMLAKAPDQRPATVQVVAERLQRLLSAPAATVVLPRQAGPATLPAVPKPAARQAHVPRPFWQSFQFVIVVLFGLVMLMVILTMTIPAIGQALGGTGQELAIPTVTTPRLLPPVATAVLTPLPVTRVETAPLTGQYTPPNSADFSVAGVTYEDDPNRIVFLGELRLNADLPQEAVTVVVSLLDANERVLATETGRAKLDLLYPGQTSPFRVSFSENIPAKFDSYTIEITSTPASEFSIGYYRSEGLVASVAMVGERDYMLGPYARGIVTNTTDHLVRFPQVIVVFYNATGQVIGLADTFADTVTYNTLMPGEEAPFETSIPTITEAQIASYLVYVQATREQSP